MLEAFKAADLIYAEDTRHTLALLNHFELKKTLVSCHTHNEKQRAAELVPLLAAGQEIVYVSDAGMPGISDPGAVLVAACIEHDLPFTVLPGASAVLTAAVLSGLPADCFSFFGFLPRENAARRLVLDRIAASGQLCLLYESPRRVRETLQALYQRLGDRNAALLRELTKKFETAERGTLSMLIERLSEDPRGECVIAVYADIAAEAVTDAALDACLSAAMQKGLSVRDAAAAAAAELAVPKKRAYRRALELLG